MRKRIRIVFLLCFATLLTGVTHAQKVSVDYDHAANFTSFHTYNWEEIKTVNTLWGDRIEKAVDQQLQAKGWQVVPSGGDVALFALGQVHNQQQEQTFYSGAGGWRWGGMGGMATTTVYNTRNGVLVVSMFDAKTKKLFWRGTSSADLADNPEKNVGKLNKSVAKMFKNFPPR
ncbi:MAG TPA: DUF4136 domain-containing protein, partial [Acidobacteriaceae bacterium]|nr:DUF4136 domain-containing protein [Acidobacteriaceae bacterium]